MDKLRVLLLHCGNNIGHKEKSNKNLFFMPMGFFALASMCVAAGADCEIMHSDIDSIEKIDLSQYNIIGMDLQWVNQAYSVISNSISFKEKNKNIFIFVGGLTASFFAEEIMLSFPSIDAIICGYGEKSIYQLCQLFSGDSTGTLKDIENLVWRQNSKIIKNGITYTYEKSIVDITNYTFFEAMKSFKIYMYLSKYWTRFIGFSDGSVFFLPIGRGCLANCLHCGGSNYANRVINNFAGSILYPHDMVIANIQKALSVGFKILYFEFENEDSDIWYMQLFIELKEMNINVKVVFGAWKLPSKELIDSISDYGESIIVLSPETSNEILRRKLKDPRSVYSNHELESCIEYMNAKGNVYCQLYFGYFLPGDTFESVKMTLYYIFCLYNRFRRIEIEYSVYTADPGSILSIKAPKLGLKSSVCTLKDYIEIFKKIYLIDNFENKPQDIRLYYPDNLDEREVILLEGTIYNFQRILYKYSRVCKSIEYKYGWCIFFNKLLDFTEKYGFASKKQMDEYIVSLILELDDEIIKKEYRLDISSTRTFRTGAPLLYRN